MKRMKYMKKRILACIMSACMMVSSMDLSAFAMENQNAVAQESVVETAEENSAEVPATEEQETEDSSDSAEGENSTSEEQGDEENRKEETTDENKDEQDSSDEDKSDEQAQDEDKSEEKNEDEENIEAEKEEAETPVENDGEESGVYNGLSYTVGETAVTIDGFTETMPANVTIPDTIAGLPVTKIARRAFWNCSKLESITLPDGLTTIEEQAFGSCSKLGSIALPASVTGIGWEAFYGCEALTTVDLSAIANPVEMIKYGTSGNLGQIFRRCAVLTTVNIPTTWDMIPDRMFEDSQIQTMDLSGCAEIKTIPRQAFWNCSSLESVTLPDGLTTIEEQAFGSCSKLGSIALPASVTGIGWEAFYGCEALTTVDLSAIANPVEMIKYGTSGNLGQIFRRCAVLTTVNIPTTWDTIPDRMFVDSQIQTMDLSGCAEIKTIPRQAFWNCSSLESVTLPDGLTTIEEQAFGSCSKLGSIALPASVTGIGWEAFYGCEALTTVDLSAIANPVEMIKYGTSGNLGKIFRRCAVLTTVNIPTTWDTIPEGMFADSQIQTMDLSGCAEIRTIPRQAFWNCSSLESVTLPDGLTTIEEQAFGSCSKLGSIALPASVTGIGWEAFYGCTKLSEVDLSAIANPVEMIKYGTSGNLGQIFRRCDVLTTVNIPTTWDMIPDRMFEDSQIQTMDLSGCAEMETIPRRTFYQCGELTTITLPSGLKTIEEQAFSNCIKLERITLPASVTGIGWEAFYGCAALTTVDLSAIANPIELITYGTSINKGRLFYGCNKLTTITIPTTWDTIPEGMFADSKIQTMDLSGCTSMETLSKRAFYQCGELTTIALPADLTTIEEQAFAYCSKLEGITLPASMTGIGWEAFYHCTKLAEFNMLAITSPLDMIKSKDNAYNYGKLFYGCDSLTTVEIPVSWEYIPDSMLRNSRIQTIDLSQNTKIETLPVRVFFQCEELGEIKFPPNLTTIEEQSFAYCKKLENITLPAGVTGIGWEAFYGCEKLNEFDLSAVTSSLDMIKSKDNAYNYGKLFYGCDSLTVVEIPTTWDCVPDGMLRNSKIQTLDLSECTKIETLQAQSFFQCEELQEIKLPANLKTIEAQAFGHCKKLESITLPASVTGIGWEAFYGCTKLSEVDLSAIENSIDMIQRDNSYGYLFNECPALTTVKVPSTWEVLPDLMFRQSKVQIMDLSNCTKLTSVPAYEFAYCKELKSVKLPNSVTEIGKSAFWFCGKLEKVYASDEVSKIGALAFEGVSKDCRVFVKRKSPACAAFLVAGIKISYQGEYKYANSVLSSEGNAYTINKNRIEVGVPCVVTVDYSCDEAKFAELSNTKLSIYIPKAMKFIDTAVTIDGKRLTSSEFTYDSDTRLLSIPVTKQSGRIKMSLSPQDGGDVQSFAQLQYDRNEKHETEIVDCLQAELKSLSLNCSDRTSTNSLYIWGITNAQGNVNVYCDDVLAGTVTANKSGEYSTYVVLPSEGQHVIKAECEDDTSVSITKYVLYKKQAVALTMFSFFYQQHLGVWLEKNLLDDPGKVLLTINPNYELLFKVGFADTSNIKDVYVVSTKGGDKKYIKAEKTAEGIYVANGFFDPSDHRYVPGQLSVAYTLDEGKTEEVIQDIELSDEEKQDAVRDYIYQVSDGQLDFSNLTVTNVASEVNGNESKVEADVDLGDGRAIHVKTTQTKQPADKTEDIKRNPTVYVGPHYQRSTYNGHPAYHSVDYTNDSFTSLVYNAVDDAYVQTYTELGWVGAIVNDPVLVNIANAMSAGRSLGILMNPNATPEMIANETANLVVIAGSYLVAAAATAAFGPAGGWIAGIAYNFIASGLQELISNIILLFIMDPSGYVYEAVEDNRLEGVKVSVYYKEHLEDPDAVLWNAADYGQQNPLYTNKFGEYAWDVPEGYWQVKYEKEGYKTTTSAWLPVPPVQTEVNVGLISEKAPQVDNAYADNKEVTMLFSQYVKVASVAGTEIKDSTGKTYTYKIKEQDALSKSVTFVLDEATDEKLAELHVSLPNTVVNYAGTALTEAFSKDVPIRKAPELVVVSETSVGYGQSKKIKVRINNYLEGMICELSNPSGMGVEAVLSETDANGDADLTLNGRLPGDYTITFSIKDTAVSTKLTVHVCDVFDEGPAPHTHTLSKVETKSATCVQTGLAEHYRCIECGEVFEDAEGKTATTAEKLVIAIDANHHVGETEIRGQKNAGTDYEGYTGDVHCKACGALLEMGNVIPALGEKDKEEVEDQDIPEGGIPEGMWIAGVDADGYMYTGAAVKPEVRVYDHNIRLKEKQDYTITYKNNVKANDGTNANTAPTITVVGKGNYAGKETATFKINPIDIASEDFYAEQIVLAYKANNQQTPAVALTYKEKVLKKNADYTYAIFKADDAERKNSLGEKVKDLGDYVIRISGKGNFAGVKEVSLKVSDQIKSVNGLKVSKIAAQTYAGQAVEPKITVSDGTKKLTENEEYTLSYRANNAIGTGYVIITGNPDKGYMGTKRVAFKINGIAMSKATFDGIPKSVSYTGTNIVLKNNSDDTTSTGIKVYLKSTAKTAQRDLTENVDYKVEYSNNLAVGKATITFTGINEFTGTVKKTFTITPYQVKSTGEERFAATLLQDEVPYVKGGAKANVKVTFAGINGEPTRILKEGRDYTLVYAANKALNDGTGSSKPTVTIKGKGNFAGSTSLNYRIVAKDLSDVTMTVGDVVYAQPKNKGNYIPVVKLTDTDGKALVVNKDYEKTFVYTYDEAGTQPVDEKAIVEAGTQLYVTVTAKAPNYTGKKTVAYRVVKSSIAKATVQIGKQTYTGKPITLSASDITVKMGANTTLKLYDESTGEGDFRIVSYANNTNKGKATVTLQGVGNYGGTKTVSFTIGTKGFNWWWRK